MNTNPAVAGKILRNFSIVTVGALGSIFAIYEVFGIATSKKMGERKILTWYNSEIRPEQDRYDTIFDRTKIMHDVKEKKPWNMTMAEKEMSARAKH